MDKKLQIRNSTAEFLIFTTTNGQDTMYLDYAEHQAEKQIPMTMKDWSKKLNAFLEFNEYENLISKIMTSSLEQYGGRAIGFIK